MFEDMTFEKILSDALDRVTDDVDKREGSIIYDALAPACMEIAKLYSDLRYAEEQSFADSAGSEWLERLCADRGLYRRQATNAVITAKMTGADVAIGTRFSCGSAAYTVTEKHGDKYYLTCETAGTAGNIASGTLIPITTVTGLESAEIVGLDFEAEDDEADESLRERYYESVYAYPFGGNVTQYKDLVNQMDGVGGCKVIPAWNGGGTVKVIIASGTYGVPSADVVSFVKEQLDPDDNGDGMGIAPIGHQVTVEGVQPDTVNVEITAAYSTGWSAENAQASAEAAIKEYFDELAEKWENTVAQSVKRVRIEARLIELDAFDDISSVKLNGAESNYTVDSSAKIPMLGTVTLK